MLNREVANLAKRKRKKASLGASLKFEIYGILLITLSVIAIYGEAAGGRSLSKLFGYLLGNFYFLLPIGGIWLGLHAMIKRSWPRGWTSRRSGFVLIGCGLTLWSAMGFIDGRLDPLNAVTPSTIFSQTLHQLYEQIWGGPVEAEFSIHDKDIGGGLLGALQYSLLFWLFGYAGSRFVLIIEFAIALMLVTNRSYVDMVRALRLGLKRFGSVFFSRLTTGRKQIAAKAVPVKGKGASRAKAVPAPVLDDDPEEEAPLAPAARKKPVFFQLFHGKPESDREDRGAPDWEEDGEPILYPAAEGPKVHIHSSGKKDRAAEPVSSLFGQRHEAPAPVAEEPPASPSWPEEEGREASFASFGEPPEEEEWAGADEMQDGEWDDDEPHEGAEPAEGAEPGTPAAEAESSGEAGEGARLAKPAAKPRRPYRMPPLHLLGKPQGAGRGGSAADNRETARKLEATLESFGVRAKVLDVARGPAVTRYELQPDTGVKVSRIVSLTDDIALALAAKDIRMEAPIPGKSAIGIEVPNSEVSVVTLREVLETQAFQEAQSRLSIAFGRDISGQPIVGNLARMPHLLVAGATGSGKSVCINGIIASILYKAKPDEVKFLMIDPKMVELNVYNGIPHLLAPVVTDPRRAALALKKVVVEMEKRYEKFSKSGTRNIEGYNTLMLSGDNPDAVLPYYVVIVDELADLMMVAAGDVEDAIMRLAQMARAAGIHLIIATQRPSVDVITGVIKANIPSRIAFGVSSQVDSRTILDMVGAEKLLGRGDMLFLPMGSSKPIRVQGAFLSDNEVEAVVSHVRGQAEASYDEELVPEVGEEAESESDEILDELFDQAVGIVLEAKQASVSLLQRRMRIGYTRAARLIDSMEARGIVGPYEGSKPREVLMTLEQFQTGGNRISS
ncbi:DNA translocase FtsK [Cohnella zeiphila]|uniref:DNA translocase FtsK n=1 Tax=Cohnella zeiphila TaxID=2761120 RepID=A0A7X0VZF0_9BACL|nr:DNA translocase FtsK [Cohnella zeiphila]MBB6735487.1 DNA translocase FtsK [Cohnella zeiphila]